MPAAKPTSDASPFATSGASTTGFGALGTGFSGFGSAFPAPSGKLTSFASSNAPAAFPGATGKLTSFASANAPASFSGTAGKLTSFASPNAPVSFGDSSDKTLGAKQSDNEESDNEAAGEANDTFVAEKTDERFHQQTGMDPSLQPIPRKPKLASRSFQVKKPVETGEENETTKFTSKGKLYYFDDKKWKERGIGTFKVNLKTDSHGKQSGRMIMRADGALRVMLNSAIWQSMPFGDNKGARPATRDIYLASKDGEKVVSLLLRVSLLQIILKTFDYNANGSKQLGNEKPAQELYDVLQDILEKI
jgi:Ran-binding protein 3